MSNITRIRVELKLSNSDLDIYKRRVELESSNITKSAIHANMMAFIRDSGREDQEVFGQCGDFRFKDDEGYDITENEIAGLKDNQAITMIWKRPKEDDGNTSILSAPDRHSSTMESETSFVAPDVPGAIGYSEKWATVNFKEHEAHNVTNILESTTGGRRFLQDFVYSGLAFNEKNRERSRQKVCDLCGNWLMENCEKKNSATPKERARMAFSIIKRFPELRCGSKEYGWGHLVCMDTYRGFLDCSIHNKRKNLPKGEKRSYTKHSVTASAYESYIYGNEEEEYEANQRYAASTTPSPLTLARITDAMKATRSVRQRKIKCNPDMTITETISEFPRFLDTPDLIPDEFKYLMENEGLADQVDILASWDEATSGIVKMAIAGMEKNPGVKQLLNSFAVQTEDDMSKLTEGACSLLALMILPYLIKPVSIKISGGMTVRTSCQFAQARLLQFFPADKPLTEVVGEIKKRDQITQPMLLIRSANGVVDPIDQAPVVYLLLDSKPLLISGTISKAVESLIASFFVFNVQYPPELEGVYQFIELVGGIRMEKAAKKAKKAPTRNAAHELKRRLDDITGKSSPSC